MLAAAALELRFFPLPSEAANDDVDVLVDLDLSSLLPAKLEPLAAARLLASVLKSSPVLVAPPLTSFLFAC